ncbi:hypothetical protein SKB0120_20670 [Moraxella osloensis]
MLALTKRSLTPSPNSNVLSIGCLGKKRRLNPKQDHLNKETALEDLALLEQAHDNFLAKLSDDERAKLVC